MLRMACSPKAGNVIETYELKGHFVERKGSRGSGYTLDIAWPRVYERSVVS